MYDFSEIVGPKIVVKTLRKFDPHRSRVPIHEAGYEFSRFRASDEYIGIEVLSIEVPSAGPDASNEVLPALFIIYIRRETFCKVSRRILSKSSHGTRHYTYEGHPYKTLQLFGNLHSISDPIAIQSATQPIHRASDTSVILELEFLKYMKLQIDERLCILGGLRIGRITERQTHIPQTTANETDTRRIYIV